MSTTSPQEKAAGETAAWQSQLASQLSGVTIPELQKMLGTPGVAGHYQTTGKEGEQTWVPATDATPGSLSALLDSTQGGSAPSTLDQSVLAGATTQLNQGYDQAQNASKESIGYQSLRGGVNRTNAPAESGAIGRAASSLERDRQTALNNLNFQSSVSSMADYNQLLQLMGQGAQTSLGLASGFGSATGSAIGGLSKNSEFGSTLGGAASGAALGAVAGVPGAVIGGVAGGMLGYFGSGG